MIRKGDTIRFMNAVGGGVVTRTDQAKGMVYVEDEDGFEIPVLARECVVVPQVNATTNFPVKDFSSTALTSSGGVQNKPVITVPSDEFEVVETPGGDVLRVLLAIIPNNIKQLHSCSYDVLLINDSNYFLFFNIITGAADARKSLHHGLMEPNIQEEIITLEKSMLNDWEEVQVQVIPFKKEKVYTPQATINAHFRIAPLKLLKVHTFTENDYFDEPAYIIDLIKKETAEMPLIDPKALKKAMYEKEAVAPDIPHKRHKVNQHPGIVEVDLHIHELVDNTAGLSNADMLQLQLDRFHKVIAEHSGKKGQKIVFIHGKGEGVLRSEILKQMKTRYKYYQYQDASFKEYGFGATMIIIR